MMYIAQPYLKVNIKALVGR